jgi:hypothetical protein
LQWSYDQVAAAPLSHILFSSKNNYGVALSTFPLNFAIYKLNSCLNFFKSFYLETFFFLFDDATIKQEKWKIKIEWPKSKWNSSWTMNYKKKVFSKSNKILLKFSLLLNILFFKCLRVTNFCDKFQLKINNSTI